MKSPQMPTPPDPVSTANAQTASNVKTATTQQQLNMVDQTNPYGSVSYTQSGTWADGTPKFSSNVTLSPEEQSNQEQQWKFDNLVNQLGINQTEKLTGLLDKPVNLNNDATESRLMELGRKRLDPVLQQRSDALETKLYNQGVMPAEDDYSFNAARRFAMQAVRARLQRWDCEAAARVDYFIANSRFVRDRVRCYYGRDAEVIYPPVDTNYFTPSETSGDTTREGFYLATGALVPYKRFDIIIDAFRRLDRRLILVGGGAELDRLRKMAPSHIDVRGWVTNEALRQLYQTAKALIVAAREDFGIVAVEAQACGCPVIAFGAGGSPEIIQDGVNGILFTEQHADDIVRAIRRFELIAWPRERVRSQVETFSREAFQTKIRKFIAERIDKEARNPELQPA